MRDFKTSSTLTTTTPNTPTISKLTYKNFLFNGFSRDSSKKLSNFIETHRLTVPNHKLHSSMVSVKILQNFIDTTLLQWFQSQHCQNFIETQTG